MNEIEKKFFETFEIEPIWKDRRSKKTKFYTNHEAIQLRKYNRNIQQCYPEITDRVLLELLAILGECNNCIILSGETYKKLRKYILEYCIDYKNFIFENVQALFKEAKCK